MIKLLKFTLFVTTFFCLAACSDRIVGKWNIVKYTKGSPGNEDIRLTNIGTMQFKKDKSGIKEVIVGILKNTSSDKSTFTWNLQDGYISIAGDTDFSKTWIRVENKRNHQILKSTDGGNIVQELELRR